MTQSSFDHASSDHALLIGIQHYRAGRLAEAETVYRQILATQPDHPDALYYLGVIAARVGQNHAAAELFAKAAALKSDWAQAHNNHGVALRQIGQTDQAIAAFARAIALSPNYPEALSNLASALRNQGRHDEAIAAYHRAIALKGDYADAHYNLGNALSELGELEQAIAAYRQAVALRADWAAAWNNLGLALKNSGRTDEAIASFRRAIVCNANLPEAHSNLGNAFYDKRLLNEAVAEYRTAIALRPNYAEAYSNLGVALRDRHEMDEAAAAFRRAIELEPGYADAYSNLGSVLKDQGALDEAIAAYGQAIALKPAAPQAHSNLLYVLHFHARYDAKAIADEHRLWKVAHGDPLKGLIQPHGNDPDPQRRLRIGYVSPDFRDHPVGRLILPLLSHHDKGQFEVFAYAEVKCPDELTARLRHCTDTWRTTAGLSDAQMADLVRGDQIDILIDLTMNMANNRLMVFARKPAPVQATYLAYCSSTGLDTIDYRLSDPHLDPPGGDESIYSEQTIRLPQTYWCYEPGIAGPHVGPLPALANGYVTFGCLNNFCKVSGPALAAWAAILRATPSSQLLLHAHEGSHRRRVLDYFERQAIAPARVQFAGFLSAEKYFDLYRRIDVALDTFPYGGGTTTLDALWMGVPVVSLAGKTAVGRGGLSILSNLGLEVLAADSTEAYIRVACDLADDLTCPGALRAALRERLRQSPLMDAPRFAANVEAAYRQMWRAWCKRW